MLKRTLMVMTILAAVILSIGCASQAGHQRVTQANASGPQNTAVHQNNAVQQTGNASRVTNTSQAHNASQAAGQAAGNNQTPQPTFAKELRGRTKPDPNDGPQIYRLHMWDARHGFAPGIHSVYLTADGGLSWTDVTPAELAPANADLYIAPWFFNSTTGLLMAELPVKHILLTYRTTDGGKSWQLLGRTSDMLGGDGGVRAAFVDPEHGWLFSGEAGNNQPLPAELLRTSDGGKTWSGQFSTDHSSKFPLTLPVTFTSDWNGWRLSYSNVGRGTLLQSTDYGSTWQPVRLPVPSNLHGAQAERLPQFATSNVGLVVLSAKNGSGRPTTVFDRTRDGGKTWTTASTLGGSLQTWTISPDHTVWVVIRRGGQSILCKSHSVGSSWKKVNAGVSKWIEHIQFIGNSGWADSHYDGSLLQTTDGGRSWHKRSFQVKAVNGP